MNNFTFTVCRAKKPTTETLTAIGEMLKVAIENLRKIEMRANCKKCLKVKELMKRLNICKDCFLSKFKLPPEVSKDAPKKKVA